MISINAKAELSVMCDEDGCGNILIPKSTCKEPAGVRTMARIAFWATMLPEDEDWDADAYTDLCPGHAVSARCEFEDGAVVTLRDSGKHGAKWHCAKCRREWVEPWHSLESYSLMCRHIMAAAAHLVPIIKKEV